jgi:hypothetical protein
MICCPGSHNLDDATAPCVPIKGGMVLQNDLYDGAACPPITRPTCGGTLLKVSILLSTDCETARLEM